MNNPNPAAAAATLKPTKYLVCVANNDESSVALRFACIKAQKRGGMVNVLHVVENADFQTLSAIAEQIRNERRAEAEQLIKRLEEEALKNTGIKVNPIIREGASIAEEIVAAVQDDIDINMLVVGVAPAENKRGKLSAWLADQLGDKLLIPLMLVPGNLTDQQIEELS